LTQLDDAEIRAELHESKRRIEEQLSSEVVALSYPVGGSDAFDDRIQRMAAQIGYRFGVSYLSGTNAYPNCEWLSLRRAHVERYTTMATLKADVAIADLLAS
jgi:peptidoglycan/xylan/chitin deacetylase (PgdA/CDA1 family)